MSAPNFSTRFNILGAASQDIRPPSSTPAPRRLVPAYAPSREEWEMAFPGRPFPAGFERRPPLPGDALADPTEDECLNQEEISAIPTFPWKEAAARQREAWQEKKVEGDNVRTPVLPPHTLFVPRCLFQPPQSLSNSSSFPGLCTVCPSIYLLFLDAVLNRPRFLRMLGSAARTTARPWIVSVTTTMSESRMMMMMMMIVMMIMMMPLWVPSRPRAKGPTRTCPCQTRTSSAAKSARLSLYPTMMTISYF